LNKQFVITVIGSGNVATQLSKKFHKDGHLINGVFSYSDKSAEELAKTTNSTLISQPNNLPKDSDIYLVSLPDDTYLAVLEKLDIKNNLLIHTSGSLKSADLSSFTPRWGCLYPLQTIKQNQEVNWSNVPFYIEAANNDDQELLTSLCKQLDFQFHIANSEKRNKLHIAAVATNNFTYHLLSTIREFCEENKIEFKDLQLLLNQSVQNSYKENAYDLQTGPAIRKDNQLIKKHLKFLYKDQNLKEIYELFTRQITNQHHDEL